MAKQLARVRKDRDGRLAISIRFAERRAERSTAWIGPGQEYFGVLYDVWEAHRGQLIDLSTWEGTGEGMIGGPTRTQVAVLLYDGPLAHHFLASSEEEIRREIKRMEDWLVDERYDFSPEVQAQIQGYIADGYRWIALESSSELR